MDAAKKKSLQITANKVRQLVIEGTYNASRIVAMSFCEPRS